MIGRRNPNERRDVEGRASRNVTALVGFVSHLLESSITLIDPWLRQFSLAPAGAPAEVPLGELIPEPLRVLTPRVVRRARRLVSRLSIVLALTVITLLLPTPPGLSAEGHRALALFVFTGSILALEPLPLPISALMVPVAEVALGLADTTTALQPFSSPTIYLILTSLFLAEALRKHGLTRRLAMTTVVFSGGDLSRLLLGIMAVAAFFSMWVENTATAAVLIPVALTIARQVPEPRKARGLLVLLILGIAYSASLGGMATIMGSAANAVAVGFLNKIGTFTFFDWFKYGFPALLLIFPVTWWLLLRVAPAQLDHLDTEPARQALMKQGPMGATEKEIGWLMAVTIFFWVTGGSLEQALSLPPTLLSSAVVAILAVGYLSARQILDWEDMKGVSWGIIFIIGAGLTLGETLTRSGATDWFAGLMEPLISGPPLLVTLLLLTYVAALLTNLLNNTTIAAVMVPILISLSRADPTLNQVQLVMTATLATTFGYSLPSASGRMALVSSVGVVSRQEMMRYGLIMTITSSAILAFYFYILSVLGLI